jgi:hypothetical protein
MGMRNLVAAGGGLKDSVWTAVITPEFGARGAGGIVVVI